MESEHIYIDANKRTAVSPYVFGHNLEHTRAAVTGGLSAQMLRNRKFAGMPSKNEGCAAEWFPIGERVFYKNDGTSYTKHKINNKMHRRNELQSQTVQNLTPDKPCGIGQHGIAVMAGGVYEIKVFARCDRDKELSVRL